MKRKSFFVYNKNMFSHLLVTSEYSFYQSTIRLEDYVRYAKKLGYQSLVLSDHNVLSGHDRFSKLCAKEGIQAIFGMEMDVQIENSTVPFLILAKDNQGYQELIRYSYQISQTGSVSYDQLKNHSGHIHIIVYGEGGLFDEALLKGQREILEIQLTQFQEDLRFFDVAISYNENQKFRECNVLLKQVCRSKNIPTVAISKVKYLTSSEAKDFHVLELLGKKKTIHDPGVPVLVGRYFYSDEEIHQYYDDEEQERASSLAGECHVNLTLFQTQLPKPFFLKDKDEKTYLKQLVFLGLQKRLQTKEIPKAYLTRIQMEFNIVCEKRFERYFLIVYEAIRYARKQNLLIGPGRGSAVGSLMAYAMGISQIDPLKYGLLFERFLNPNRTKMPDIDIDIASQDRPLLLNYLQKIYGYEHVALISTFHSLASVEVIQALCQCYTLKEREARSLSLAVKKARAKYKVDNLRVLQERDIALQNAVKQSKACQEVFAMAQKLEGLYTSDSIHPAGIVLSEKSLLDVVPVMESNGFLKIQWDKDTLETHGLIKMDFLSLSNLDFLKELLHQTNLKIDTPHLDLEDQDSYALLNRGLTAGLFQLDAPFLRQQLPRLKPNSFMELVNVLGIARPQAVQHIPQYVENKRSEYPKSIQELVKNTHGVFIFQEQVMRLLVEVTGMNFAQAETIRKNGCKEPELIKGLEEKFTAIHPNLWRVIQEFISGFGFNLSHGVAYGLLAYQMLYIKAHDPLTFYSVLLNQSLKSNSLMATILKEMRLQKIPFYSFDLRCQEAYCRMDKEGIQLGLMAIPSLRYETIEAIQKDFKENGPYENYFQCVARLSLLGIHSEQVLECIKVGALDFFGYSRSALIHQLEDAFRYASLCVVHQQGKKYLNFELVSSPVLQDEKESLNMKRQYEQSVLSYSLQLDPSALVRQKNHWCLPFLKTWSYQPDQIGLATVTQIKEHQDKNGHYMAFVRIEDESGQLEVLIFSQLYETLKGKLQVGQVIRMKGRITNRQSIELVKLERVG
ncbi:DNA polymerase III, alpha subunit [Bulleidia extructa W1219]|uniref:DNA-directed DNA polymerase n=2 Tax=Bulleidia TaxID=118747 RepID=D2MQB2_9FIRM|nr:DNA polymerase III, alpha subunit [Bulleidia extructa W1219]